MIRVETFVNILYQICFGALAFVLVLVHTLCLVWILKTLVGALL